jgi:hypothetical protein
MSEVFREIELSWDGEVYTIVPSMALLKRVKAQGINNLVLANACIQGGADPIDMAIAHRIFMKDAGVTIAEDDSYGFIMSGTEEMIGFQMAYVSAVLPAIDLGKKPVARSTKPRAKKANNRKAT